MKGLSNVNTNKTAIVVDDEKDIGFFLKPYLVRKNLDCELAYSISEAKTLLSKVSPDIVFLDNHLPDGYGINIIRYIKDQHESAIVVMISAYDNDEDKKKAFEEGIDYFISKPFGLDEIDDLLKNIMGNSGE